MSIRNIITSLIKRLWKEDTAKSRIKPEKLPSEVMVSVMQEASFLRKQHSVDVRELSPDEIPTIPKNVED